MGRMIAEILLILACVCFFCQAWHEVDGKPELKPGEANFAFLAFGLMWSAMAGIVLLIGRS